MSEVLCLYGGKPAKFKGKGKNAVEVSPADPMRGKWLPSPENRLRVLNFSGGKQSSALLWMAIRGEIERPDVVLTANPGMEAAASLAYVAMMQAECAKVGIKAYTVKGPNLYEEILNLKQPRQISVCVKCGNQVTGARHAVKCPCRETKIVTLNPRTRFDTPAYYVLREDGREGKLDQRCTAYYKIAPMNRACRVELESARNVSCRSSRVPRAIIEKWIGFSASEVSRVKPPVERWACFRYPLIDMGYTNEKVVGYFLKHDLPMPPRSVCNGCFANDVEYFRDMHRDRPADWAQALAVDEAIRDWKQIGVKLPVFITRCCKSLNQLQAEGFKDDDKRGGGCDSGYCMT